MHVPQLFAQAGTNRHTERLHSGMTRRRILVLAIAAAVVITMRGSCVADRPARAGLDPLPVAPSLAEGPRATSSADEPGPSKNPFAGGGHGTLVVAVRSRRDGSPVAGARVEVVALADADCGRRRRSEAADDSGEARFEGVPAGALRILAAGATRPWALESGTADRVEVAVDPPVPAAAATTRSGARDAEPPAPLGSAFVEGCARDEAGRPLARVIVTARAEGSAVRLAQAATAADGTYRLDGLPAAIVSLRAGFLAGEPVQGSVDLRAAGRAVWDAALVTGRLISGAVFDEHGAPRPFAVVRARSIAGGETWEAETVADREGRFEVANAALGRLVVEVEPARWAEGNAWTVETAASGPVPLEVVVPEAERPSAFLSGRLVDAAGAPRSGAFVSAVRAPRPSDRPAVAFASEADGSFRIGPLGPGPWVLETPARSGTRALLAERVLAPGDEVDVGEVRAAGEGFVKVSLKRGARAPRSQRIEVFDRLSRRVATLRPAADFAASGPLAPGAYTLRLGGPGVAERESAFVVREGGTTTLEVSVEAGSGVSR